LCYLLHLRELPAQSFICPNPWVASFVFSHFVLWQGILGKKWGEKDGMTMEF